MKENLYPILNELKINFTEYVHPPVFTVAEADEYWHNITGMHCKNIFLRDKRGKQHYLLVAPKDKKLSIKFIDNWLGNERLSFASEERLDKYLKLKAGSVTPFGIINDTNKHVILLLDSELQKADLLGFHPNENTATITISLSDFEKFLNWSQNKYVFLEIKETE